MYLEFYHLREKPFQITPNPEFLYLSPSHQEALATLNYGVEEGKGLMALIGEVGLGKTTLLHEFLKRRNNPKEKIIYLFNSRLTFIELLRALTREMDLDTSGDDPQVFLDHLYQALIKEYASGRSVILLLDDAQVMPKETLEGLRLISNLETPTEKLIQIALVGQPELEKKLDLHDLRQLRQRIAVKATLAPLTRQESLDYIKFRINKAGGRVESILTPGALNEIIRRARGIPRVINILCDNALVTGYGYNQKPVTPKVVREVSGDLGGGRRNFPRHWAIPAFAAVLLALSVLVGYFQWPDSKPKNSILRLETGLSKNSSVSAAPPAKTEPSTSAVDKPAREPISEPGVSKITAPEKNPSLPVRIPQLSSPSGKEAKAREEKPLPAAEEQPSGADKKTFPQTRIVREGQNLSQMVMEVYGVNRMVLWDLVRRHNPQIKEDMTIHPGQKLVFPAPDQASADDSGIQKIKARGNRSGSSEKAALPPGPSERGPEGPAGSETGLTGMGKRNP